MTNEFYDLTVRDYRYLGRRLMRPARPRLPEVLGVICGLRLDADASLATEPYWVAMLVHSLGIKGSPNAGNAGPGIQDPGEAWAELARRGLIPVDWKAMSGRKFLYGSGLRLAHPVKLSTVAALASDPAGVEEAEALGRDWLARSQIWRSSSDTPCETALWRAIDRPFERRDRLQPSPRGAVVVRAAAEDRLSTPAVEKLAARIKAEVAATCHAPRAACVARAARDALSVELWDLATRRGWTMPASPDFYAGMPSLVGRPFADFPNPFTALVRVWELGYERARDHSTLLFRAPEL